MKTCHLHLFHDFVQVQMLFLLFTLNIYRKKKKKITIAGYGIYLCAGEEKC